MDPKSMTVFVVTAQEKSDFGDGLNLFIIGGKDLSNTRKVGVFSFCENNWYGLDQDAIAMIREFCSDNDQEIIKITFEKEKSTRSVEANSYYWGVVVTGYQREWPDLSKEHIHRILGDQFRKFRRDESEIEILKEQVAKAGGTWREENEWFVKGSSDMDTYQFWLYCEQCTVALMEIGGSLGTYEEKQYQKVKKMFGEKKDES